MAVEPIKIDGLRAFTKSLKELDAEAPKALRVAFNGAADIVVTEAKPKVPRVSGKASGSIKARSTRTAVRIAAGGNRAPWYPWLDFGGRVGKNRSVRRPFLKEGRYIYKAFFANRDRVGDVTEQALIDVAKKAGLEVE